MVKKPTVFKWEDLDNTHTEVAKTLLVNIKALKGLLETPEFAKLQEHEVYTAAEAAFVSMSKDYRDRLTGLQAMRTSFGGGVVPTEESHKFYHLSQQYHNLLVDITNTAVAFGKILINLKNQTMETVDVTP